MSTAFTAALDIQQGAAVRLGKVVDEMSGGRFKIEVLPDGQIMKAFECFDATSQGKVQAFMGVGSYWVAKEPAFSWFHTIPYGVNQEVMCDWYYLGCSLRLIEDALTTFHI